MIEQLSDQEFLRYSRHLLLSEIGETGQLKLKQSKVLIVGLGGLGSVAALYLAAAGVGQLWLADHDLVDKTNLQRQILYENDRLNEGKAELARERLLNLNPEIELISVNQKLDEALLPDFVSQVDLVLDCSDNMPTRLAVNLACVEQQKPLISGAAIGFDGQLVCFSMQSQSPCYVCLFPEPVTQSENCSNAGILGPVAGTIGSMQALQALKFLTSQPDCQLDQLFCFDGKTLDWQRLTFQKNHQCQTCGSNTYAD